MLYLLHMKNHELTYKGGQEPIIHLVADLKQTINWANRNGKRWVFSTSNAGSYYFEDYCDLKDLNKINWNVINETQWANCKEEKQAKFLIEDQFPWKLVEQIGVISPQYFRIVNQILTHTKYQPPVNVKPKWYY